MILCNIFPAMCIEKVVVRNSGEELYNKMFQSPIAPQRVVLKPNLNYERLDTTSSDARTSFDHSDKHCGTYRETCRREVDSRIRGFPFSAVQEHDHVRKHAVQKLIHQYLKSSVFLGRPTPISDEEWEQWHGSHGSLFFCLRDLSCS